MIGFKLTKKDKLFKTNIIDYILVSWVMLNEEVYLENFYYDSTKQKINCSARIKPEIWCFTIDLPTDLSGVFFVSSNNSEPSEKQIQLINEINIHALIYDYTDYINDYDYKNDTYYEIQKSILVKFLNQLNDKCSDYEAVIKKEREKESKSTSESDVEYDFEDPIFENKQITNMSSFVNNKKNEDNMNSVERQDEQLIQINYKISEMLFEETCKLNKNMGSDLDYVDTSCKKDTNYLSNYVISENNIDDVWADDDEFLNKYNDMVTKCNQNN